MIEVLDKGFYQTTWKKHTLNANQVTHGVIDLLEALYPELRNGQQSIQN